MLLVTGPTGSGKTTTLYAAITEINNGQDKIVTIEDPVEYQLPGVLQIPVNEKKRSEEHTSELQSPVHLVCRLLLEKKKKPTRAARWLYRQLARKRGNRENSSIVPAKRRGDWSVCDVGKPPRLPAVRPRPFRSEMAPAR